MFFTPLRIKGFYFPEDRNKHYLEDVAWRLAEGSSEDSVLGLVRAIKHPDLTAADLLEYAKERRYILVAELHARRKKQDRLKAHITEIGYHMTSTMYNLPTLNKTAFVAFTTPMQQQAVFNYVHAKLRGAAVPSLDRLMGPTPATILNIAKHYARHQIAACPSMRADELMLADLTQVQRDMLEQHIVCRVSGDHVPVDFHAMGVTRHPVMVTINAYVREQLKKRRRNTRMQKKTSLAK